MSSGKHRPNDKDLSGGWGSVVLSAGFMLKSSGMKKRLIVLLVLSLPVAAALIFWITRPEANVKSEGMNLLVITIDTLRADRLGCYGDGLARTPVIDRLAEEAFCFKTATRRCR